MVPMCNLLEYSSNYSKTTGSLCSYSKDEAANFDNAIANTDNFKSFKYQTKLKGSTGSCKRNFRKFNNCCVIKIIR